MAKTQPTEVEAAEAAAAEAEAEAAEAAAAAEEAPIIFTAARFPIRNPYTHVLYDRYGHFTLNGETGDSLNFINVQLKAGMLKLVEI